MFSKVLQKTPKKIESIKLPVNINAVCLILKNKVVFLFRYRKEIVKKRKGSA